MDLELARAFLAEVTDRYPFPENEYEKEYLRKHLERYKDSCDVIAANCPKDQPLLSIGCEPGHIEMLLKRFYGFSRITGLTYRASEEFKARMDSFDIPILQGDIERDAIPSGDNTYAGIVFLETLEHMFNGVPFALKEMYRVLCKGGHLVLSTPNLAQLRNRFKLLKGKSINWPLHGSKDFFGRAVHLRHNREYTSKEVIFLLQQAGFGSATVKYSDYSPRMLMGLFNSLYPSFKSNMFLVAEKL
ncbi:MAG: class I SAM-dependent methyltransferase [Desulfuromonadales bacterium]|nr:MAG: class I SAM-dependent methyltransferase [Desulfuromonadales bacterium]